MKIEADIEDLIELVGTAIETHTTAFFRADNTKQVLTLSCHQSLSDNIIKGVSIPFGYGPIGWVAENREVFDLSKFSDRDSGLLKIYSKNEEIKSFAAAPVLRGDILIGVLCIDSKRAYVFTHKEQKLLTMFAEVFADTINNMVLRDLINADLSGIELLSKLCKDIINFDKIDNILKMTLDSIVDILKCDDCFICLRISDEKPYFRIEAVNYHVNLRNTIFSEQDGLAGSVISSGDNCLLANRGNDLGAKLFRSSNSVSRFSSFLGVPFFVHNKVVGLICAIDGRKNYFNQRDLQIISVIGSNIATAVSYIKSQEKVNSLSKLLASKEHKDNIDQL